MRLSLLRPTLSYEGPWASVYADTSHATEDAAKRQELAARAVTQELADLGTPAATRDAVHRALLTSPEPGPIGRPPASGKRTGRAVFATNGEVVVDVPLPGPPTSPLTTWSALPRLTPLLSAVGDPTPCLVAYVDHTGADFEVRDDAGQRESGQVEGADWPVRKTASADWSERHFQAAVENTWERNAAEIADAAQRMWERCGAEVMLLVGDARERKAVRERLPEPLRAVTAESEHGARPTGSGSERLERDIAQVRAAHESERLTRTLDRYHAGQHDDGTAHAVAGVPALVEAAREHQIETLLVAPAGQDAGREVWIGPGSDQLAVRGSELQYLGAVNPAPARADDALLRAAIAGGAEAVAVSDPALAPAGGLGALLRWPASPH
ncbi:Vms1/Ankzf1 family peptidyl-tRNA hydrolase [Streptomyces sp. NPDC057702]|uniref:baeRF2 domain-containing protein n=1 Tax=unclassified Streptomyces TaxID=2593676 RepID=UPI0036BF83DE